MEATRERHLEGPAPCATALQLFPLTRDNMRDHFPKVMEDFFSCDVKDVAAYKSILQQLYTPGAVFDYPLAEMRGRDQITSFWTHFLTGRKGQLLDTYHLRQQVTWDPSSLRLVLHMEARQSLDWLKWLNRLLGPACVWKVLTIQLFQFEEYPADGPGALRVSYHEEWLDQLIFFGTISVGIYKVGSDPGTPLNWARSQLRRFNGQLLHSSAQVVDRVLGTLGLL